MYVKNMIQYSCGFVNRKKYITDWYDEHYSNEAFIEYEIPYCFDRHAFLQVRV